MIFASADQYLSGYSTAGPENNPRHWGVSHYRRPIQCGSSNRPWYHPYTTYMWENDGGRGVQMDGHVDSAVEETAQNHPPPPTMCAVLVLCISSASKST